MMFGKASHVHVLVKWVAVAIVVYILFRLVERTRATSSEIEPFFVTNLGTTVAGLNYPNQFLYRINKFVDVINKEGKMSPKKTWTGLTGLNSVIGMRSVDDKHLLLIDALQQPYMVALDKGADHDANSAVYRVTVPGDHKITKTIIDKLGELYYLNENGTIHKKTLMSVPGSTNRTYNNASTHMNAGFLGIDFAYTKHHDDRLVVLRQDGFLQERGGVTFQGTSYRFLNVTGNRQALDANGIKYVGFRVKCSGGTVDNANKICYGPGARFAYEMYYIRRNDNTVHSLNTNLGTFREMIGKLNTKRFNTEMHEYGDMYRVFVTFPAENLVYVVEINKSFAVTNVIKINNVFNYGLCASGHYVCTLDRTQLIDGLPWSNSTLIGADNTNFVMYPPIPTIRIGKTTFEVTNVNHPDIIGRNNSVRDVQFSVFQLNIMNTTEMAHIHLFDMYDTNNFFLLANNQIH